MYRLCLMTAIVVWAGAVLAPDARAGCSCVCYDGRMLPSCSNTYDIPPICPATICTRPSITPSPPLTTRSNNCRDEQFCDQFNRCEWRNSCDKSATKPGNDSSSNNPLSNNR